MLNLYDVCVNLSFGLIGTVFSVAWERLLSDLSPMIQSCLDLIIGNVSGMTRMIGGG
jgi:hypothetical protein